MPNLVPFGPWHPDAASINAKICIEARNVVPAVTGYLSLEQMLAATAALPSACRGAVSVLLDDGSVQTYAGTQTGLYKLSGLATWDDVTRISGGDYSVGAGEQWKWSLFGTNLVATNVVDGAQKIDVEGGTAFSALANAPAARYVDVIRDFLLLGAVFGNEKRVQWSGNNNIEGWTAGVNESDYQDFPNGGPVRGVIGGEIGYVLQASKVTRMTYVPGGSSGLIFQFDEIEGASGIAAPNSLVRLRSDAYYFARDGFRKLGLSAGSSQPIGIGKWNKWLLADLRAGSDFTMIGAANPVRPIIVWAYISKGNSSTTADRMLIYDWSIDEAAFADVSTEALMQWLSPGVTLDTMNSYGSLDALPFSLDSPFWRGGAGVMGLFGTDHKLALQSGLPMAATLVTNDGQGDSRYLIKGTRPAVDTPHATVALAARERYGDNVVWSEAEAMEDTGVCPAHISGNYVRAKITVPAGVAWSQAQGIDTVLGRRGRR